MDPQLEKLIEEAAAETVFVLSAALRGRWRELFGVESNIAWHKMAVRDITKALAPYEAKVKALVEALGALDKKLDEMEFDGVEELIKAKKSRHYKDEATDTICECIMCEKAREARAIIKEALAAFEKGGEK